MSQVDEQAEGLDASHTDLEALFPDNARHPVTVHRHSRAGTGNSQRRHTGRQKRHGRKVLFFSGVLVGLPLIAVALIAVLIPTVVAPVHRFDGNPFPTDRQSYAAVPGAMNVLLIGSDTRAATLGDVTSGKSTGERSDTMILVHVDAARDQVAVVSLMRDLYVPVPGHGTTKLNAAFSYGGVPLTVQTVETLLKTRIDHVGIVDFDGFAAMSDAVGGVPVDSPKAFSSRNMPGYHFDAGRNVIAGQKALAFVRERYAFPDADFQRVKNQQAFVAGLVDVAFHGGADLVKLTRLARAVGQNVTVDDGFTTRTAVQLGWSLRKLPTRDYLYLTAPTAGTGTEHGQSVVYPDKQRMAALQSALTNDKTITPDMGGNRG